VTATRELDRPRNRDRQTGIHHLIRTERYPRAWDKSAVAALTASEIEHLSDAELVEAIRGSGLPVLRRETEGRLEFYGRQTLERLVWLARRCCRNQGY
jgi:hypothetical protein